MDENSSVVVASRSRRFLPFKIIRLRREEESLDNIGQYWVQCETPELKYKAIANIYGVVTIGQAMIFCQTRKTASWLVQKMTKDGHAVALLSGELTVEERIQVEYTWKIKILFSLYRQISLSVLGPRPLPRRSREDPDHHERDVSRHRRGAGDHRRQLRPASRRQREGGLRDIPTPHRQDRKARK